MAAPTTTSAAIVLPTRKRLGGGPTGGGATGGGLGYHVAAGLGDVAGGAGAYGADTVAGSAVTGPATERWHSQQKLAYSPISAPQCGHERLVELAAGRSSTTGNATATLRRRRYGPS
jgi:hypothetical protein